MKSTFATKRLGPAAARQSHPRVLEAADHAGVDIAVLVDLGRAEKPVVEVTALRIQEDIGDICQHVRAVCRLHLVGGDGQPAGQRRRADDAALQHDRQVRRVHTPGHRGR
jgi:hypothetical protein